MMDSQSQQAPAHAPSLDDCLKLLKGERDEQRLAGLLLVTKFCKGDDVVSLRKVYDAVGPRFLDRLLRTGLGKGINSGNSSENRGAYLQLSVTVLAAFCRVPEIASSEVMVSKIPLILELMSKESGASILEECYEFLYLVMNATGDGVTTLYESGGMKVLAFQISTFPDGSHLMELAIGLLQLMLNKLSLEIITKDSLSELSMMVMVVTRQFAVLHNALKFEALHLLTAVLSSNYSTPLHEALRVVPDSKWSMYMHVGVVAILQNRVAAVEKLQALILTESMVSIKGEEWLIHKTDLPDIKDSIPADRCLLLVLESSRVEIAVLLNDLAYLKYEAPKNTSTAENFLSKQRNVAIAFSLVEKIIRLISNIVENEGGLIDDSTLTMVMNGLNETIGVVLEYLQDAKEHEQNKGNDLLASVRLVGSYLAETPNACKEKVRELLQYMLSIEGEDEPSPFYSICFLLPMLCQTTMEIEGCKALASSGVYKAVVECLIKLIGPGHIRIEDDGCIFLACDTVLNLLLKKEQVQYSMDESTSVHLLKALAYWTENTTDPSIIMMASCICSLIFDSTSEDALVNNPYFDSNSLTCLSRLIAGSLASWGQNKSDVKKENIDLLEIVTAGYSRWAQRFPHIREAIERC